jgi:hypothetical protein
MFYAVRILASINLLEAKDPGSLSIISKILVTGSGTYE